MDFDIVILSENVSALIEDRVVRVEGSTLKKMKAKVIVGLDLFCGEDIWECLDSSLTPVIWWLGSLGYALKSVSAHRILRIRPIWPVEMSLMHRSLRSYNHVVIFLLV